ncbi:MAG: hypothetical protein IJ685_13805 [Selenomonadaceae bacterium]|nr:hypothetical protein [Selenomonadaceae bacterium]
MSGWNFPSNGGGAINGVADSGIEIFRGKEISSLAREICQNSLDAAIDENFPVTVEFQRHEISSNDIPDVYDFAGALKACQIYWTGASNKTAAFIKTATFKLKSLRIPVLRISDFNTTGLAEPFNSRAMTGWNTLTKINGGAIKSDDKAGNFGIGKNAPFANSFFRMVFYRTFNKAGEHAAQGVAKLVSFNLDAWNIATGVCYFGEPRGNMPVKKIPELDKIFQRVKRGTDVFIYGFNGGEEWTTELVDELIKNFLVAIHRYKLRVTVQGQAITKATLGKFVKDDAANYYKILTGNNAVKFFDYDFHGMGKLKLGVLLDPTTKLNRKVLIVRKSGMKLFELDRISRTLNFTAILELDGFKLNAFFRQMETPDHTNWEPTRHPTYPKKAKEYLAELKKWVRNKIESLGEENISDEIEVTGVITPNNDSDPNPPVIIGTKPPVKRNPQQSRPSRPTPPRPTDDKSKIACDKIRVIKVGDKSYRLILKVPSNISGGRIEIFAVGESNSSEKLFITRVASFSENIDIQKIGDEIVFRNLRGNVDVRINFELTEDKNYALGVAVHED